MLGSYVIVLEFAPASQRSIIFWDLSELDQMNAKCIVDGWPHPGGSGPSAVDVYERASPT